MSSCLKFSRHYQRIQLRAQNVQITEMRCIFAIRSGLVEKVLEVALWFITILCIVTFEDAELKMPTSPHTHASKPSVWAASVVGNGISSWNASR